MSVLVSSKRRRLPHRTKFLVFSGGSQQELVASFPAWKRCSPFLCGSSGGPGQDGVAVFAPDATLLGRMRLPERWANLCCGGRTWNRLFMTASQSVYALYVEAQGNPGG